VQSKLLKVLEDKQLRRVGSVQSRPIDFRLIAATHRDLNALVSAEKFRSDLFYRINTVRLRMPALRERLEDMPVLAREVLAGVAGELGRGMIELAPDALPVLTRYRWPGNIRELRNVLERAALLCRNGNLTAKDLRLEGDVSIARDAMTLEGAERAHIEKVLKMTNGNIPQAARLLGISKSTLYSKMREHEAVAVQKP
jgi:DNA-binding NtrC family response regulator